jgi:hypothetical protein
MNLDELDNKRSKIEQIDNETEDFLGRINETKVELDVLMLKTHNYMRNTSLTYQDSIPQRTEEPNLYSRSPFGQSLCISDYSYSIPTTGPKKQKSPFL